MHQIAISYSAAVAAFLFCGVLFFWFGALYGSDQARRAGRSQRK